MPDSQDPQPRGSRRIVYVSDPSSVASRYLPDPVREEDLRNWIDAVAAAGIDTFVQEVYTQGWSVYWRGEDFEYDARPQHRRFLPLLDSGVQPFEILVDQCHRRGIECLAGFRVNDNHGAVSIAQGVGAGAGFIVDNPRLQLTEHPPEGEHYRETTPLDFTHEEVRGFILSVVTEVASRFAVDGVELCYRDHRYFPPDTGNDRRGLMTGMLQGIRAVLDEPSPHTGKPRVLGARVFSTPAECLHLGLDIEKWIREGTVDYISPQDPMYADFNLPFEEFAGLTRSSRCMLYPAILPWTSFAARKRLDQEPISPDTRRALARNMYGAGADGISLYNHFEYLHGGGGAHPPFYPFALFDACDLKPERVLQGRRHYIFDATWGGYRGFGLDRTSSGAVKAQRVVLPTGCGPVRGDLPLRSARGSGPGQGGHAALPRRPHDAPRPAEGRPQRHPDSRRGPADPRRRAARRSARAARRRKDRRRHARGVLAGSRGGFSAAAGSPVCDLLVWVDRSPGGPRLERAAGRAGPAAIRRPPRLSSSRKWRSSWCRRPDAKGCGRAEPAIQDQVAEDFDVIRAVVEGIRRPFPAFQEEDGGLLHEGLERRGSDSTLRRANPSVRTVPITDKSRAGPGLLDLLSAFPPPPLV